MNIKLISKALHTLSLLSDEDVAIVFGLRSASEDERSVLVLALEPNSKPQKKSSERVIEHCAACDYTRRAQVHKDTAADGYHEFQPQSSKKSAGGGGGGTKSRHASSLGQQIQKRQRRTTADESDDDNRFDGAGAQAARAEFLGERCTVLRGDLSGTTCGLLPDHNVHHLESVRGYHPFVSTAQPAEPSSNPVTSGTGKGVVSNVHHVASSGD